MTDRRDELDALVGDDLSDDERARLEHVHALLRDAGPLPELPPSLADPPSPPSENLVRLPHRRRWTAVTALAAAAVVLLAVGYGIGNRSDVRPPVQTIPLAGTGNASGSIEVFAEDDAGNWPMRLSVSGLPHAEDGRYEVWLTRDGTLTDSCGTFDVAGGSADVRLNAPYELRTYDDWVVVEHGSTVPVLATAGSAPTYREPPGVTS
jgi:Anti-sigma-K factor rskA, C-terminal